MFYGPFGNGKTTLAQALAQQVGIPVISVDHCSTNEETIEKIENIAKNAKERTAILLDELDILAPKDSRTNGRLKQLMDKISSEYGCTLFATTNYPENIDRALLRDGRFIKLGIPPADKENTKAVIEYYVKQSKNLSSDIDYNELANIVVKSQPNEAYSNDRIREIIQRISEEAIKTGKILTQKDLLDAINKSYPDIKEEDMDLFRKNCDLLKQ